MIPEQPQNSEAWKLVVLLLAFLVVGSIIGKASQAEVPSPTTVHLVAGAVACGHFFAEEDSMEDVLKVVALCLSKGPAELTRLGLGIEKEFDKRRPQASGSADVVMPQKGIHTGD